MTQQGPTPPHDASGVIHDATLMHSLLDDAASTSKGKPGMSNTGRCLLDGVTKSTLETATFQEPCQNRCTECLIPKPFC